MDGGNGWMAEEELAKYMNDVIEAVKGLRDNSGDEVSVSPMKSGEMSGEKVLNSGDVSGEVTTSNSSFTMTPMHIILICILCAIIASATTAVVIILINKNRK